MKFLCSLQKALGVLTFLNSSICIGHLIDEGGSGTGNGGNSLVCFFSKKEVDLIKKNNHQILNSQLDPKNGKVEKIVSLDLEDAYSSFIDRAESSKRLILPHAQELPHEYANRMIERLNGRYVTLHGNLKKIHLRIKPHYNRYYNDYGLERIQDTGKSVYGDPGRCVIATMIRRNYEGHRIELEYDNRLYSHPKHSLASKGVIELHERVAAYTMNVLGHTDASSASSFIRNILIREKVTIDDVLEEMDDKDLLTLDDPNVIYVSDKSLKDVLIKNYGYEHNKAKVLAKVLRNAPETEAVVAYLLLQTFLQKEHDVSTVIDRCGIKGYGLLTMENMIRFIKESARAECFGADLDYINYFYNVAYNGFLSLGFVDIVKNVEDRLKKRTFFDSDLLSTALQKLLISYPAPPLTASTLWDSSGVSQATDLRDQMIKNAVSLYLKNNAHLP